MHITLTTAEENLMHKALALAAKNPTIKPRGCVVTTHATAHHLIPSPPRTTKTTSKWITIQWTWKALKPHRGAKIPSG
jgi:hypothetical protein